MRIVINAQGIFKVYPEMEMDRYFTDCLIRLVSGNPQSEFWALASPFFRQQDWGGLSLAEITYRNWLPGQWGENLLARRSLRSVLGRQKADLLLTIGRAGDLSTSTPQIIWIPGSEGNAYLSGSPSLLKKLRTEKVSLMTDSAECRSLWIEQFSLPPEKIFVVPIAASEKYQALGWSDKEQTKVRYAGGKEYFLTKAHYPEKNLMSLLRAFSLFKKKQQTNMNLVIAGIAGEPNQIPYDKLETYKYRHDVHVYAGLSEKDYIKITASAYALVQPFDQVSAASVLNAFQAGVPVISAAVRQQSGIGAEAMLGVEMEDPEMIADGMKLLFNNENTRSELIRKGEIRAAQHSIQQAATSLWNALTVAAGV